MAFTSEDRVRDVIRNFNADGFGSLYPKSKGGRLPKFSLPQRREFRKITKSKAGRAWPAFLGLEPVEAGGVPTDREVVPEPDGPEVNFCVDLCRQRD